MTVSQEGINGLCHDGLSACFVGLHGEETLAGTIELELNAKTRRGQDAERKDGRATRGLAPQSSPKGVIQNCLIIIDKTLYLCALASLR